MSWSKNTWATITKDYKTILQMPFIKELADGSLPMEKFQFYMAQDALYLDNMARAMAVIASKAGDTKDTLSFLRFAEMAIVVEQALHASFFKNYGVIKRTTMQPACHHYMSYLKSTAAYDNVEVAMASVLPCFWIYKKVGDHIYKTHNTRKNPYSDWIKTYSGEDYGKAVKEAIIISDRVAKGTTKEVQRRMTEAFQIATKMEFYFWEAAYIKRRWL